MATVLILGAYGFIGSEVTRACISSGHRVHVLGRDGALLDRLGAEVTWRRDLRHMTKARDWIEILNGVEIVVNAAGVLQDGARDDVARVQFQAILAMAEGGARTGIKRIVQISATGAWPDAATPFMATKYDADAMLLASGIATVVLRPGLVLGRSVYGGTALLRMLAAFPQIQPIALAGSSVQVVAMSDVVRGADLAIRGKIPCGRAYDLVADKPVSLLELVTRVRAWLGFPRPWRVVRIGGYLSRILSRIADGLSFFGWRSPLRSSAMAVLEQGVTGDPAPWSVVVGRCRSLDEILKEAPSTAQDRIHARMALAMPLTVGSLALFWLTSGAIGLVSFRDAVGMLTAHGMEEAVAMLAVGAGSLADLALGAAVLFRRRARMAMLGMIGLSLWYLVAGSIWTPDLWLDPLGPFVKVVPGMVLAAIGWALLEPR